MPKGKDRGKEHYLKELKEMVEESKEPTGKVLTNFCHRHGISMDECRKYYDDLLSKGEIKRE